MTRSKPSPHSQPRELLCSHLSDEFFLALGRVTATFAQLEYQLKLLAGLLIHRTDQELGHIVTAELPFRGVVALVSSLALYRFGDGPLRSELEALLTRAANVEDRRNRVTHSDWGSGTTSGKRVRIKLTARKGKGLLLALEDMTSRDIDEIATEASAVATEITKLWVRLSYGGRVRGGAAS